MDLKHEFETETGQGISFLEGKEAPEDNGNYNDTYVKWLEQKLVNLFDIPVFGVQSEQLKGKYSERFYEFINKECKEIKDETLYLYNNDPWSLYKLNEMWNRDLKPL